MPARVMLVLAIALIPALAAPAQDRAALRFQPNANRLLPGFEGILAQVRSALAAAPDTVLVMLAPHPADAAHRRLVAARQSELDRQLARLGLSAEHQADPQMEADGNELALLLRRPAAAPELAPAPPDPPLWVAEAGRTLRETLQDWAAKAGWTLVWQSSFDYPLMAPARLDGDFAAAVAALLRGFSEATPPPAARIFRANNVVIIH
jgi:hypothetical protein